MNRHRLLMSFGAAALCAACGDAGPAVQRNDPGTGSNTMLVQAEIEAQDVPGGFVTQMEVQLKNGQGSAISGATVTIRNGDLGTVTLLEDGVGSGTYKASVNSFPSGDFRLDAVRGDDKVERVIVGGIGVHRITSPEANATVPANQPLLVQWSRPSEALGAELETRDFDANNIADTGEFTIPGSANPPRTDQRIRVWRFNQVQIAGGLPGSQFKLEVRNTVEPVVVQ